MNGVAKAESKYVRTCIEDMIVDVEATFEDILDGTHDHKEASLHCPFLLCISNSHLEVIKWILIHGLCYQDNIKWKS